MTQISDILHLNGPAVPVSVEADAPLATAAELMDFYSTRTVLVLDEGELVGILAKRDILARALEPARDPDTTQAQDIMTASPLCVQLHSSVSDAIRLMRSQEIAHLPVIDGGLPVGVISLRDAIAAKARDLRTENRELRGLFTDKIHKQAVSTESYF